MTSLTLKLVSVYWPQWKKVAEYCGPSPLVKKRRDTSVRGLLHHKVRKNYRCIAVTIYLEQKGNVSLSVLCCSDTGFDFFLFKFFFFFSILWMWTYIMLYPDRVDSTSVVLIYRADSVYSHYHSFNVCEWMLFFSKVFIFQFYVFMDFFLLSL